MTAENTGSGTARDGPMETWTGQIREGDARETMLDMPASSVHCVVTSIPYYGKRDYGDEVDAAWGGDGGCDHQWAATRHRADRHGDDGHAGNLEGSSDVQAERRVGAVESDYCRDCGAWRGQFGLEPTLDQYVRNVVEVADAVAHVLREDGVCFLNLGDTYASKPRGNRNPVRSTGLNNNEGSFEALDAGHDTTTELASKQKMLVPHRVAIALQAAGWWVRQDVVWAKSNSVPDPVTDRRREDKEFVFHLTQQAHYWYDLDAIREPYAEATLARVSQNDGNPVWNGDNGRRYPGGEQTLNPDQFTRPGGKNPGDILEIPTRPYSDAHYATFPPDLVEPFVKVGCPPEVCATCGTPYERETEKRPLEEWPQDVIERDQRRRALQRADEAGLTTDHFEAIRTVGGRDAGQATLVSDGAATDADETERLAAEAKNALGEHFREFLAVAEVPTGNWLQACDCDTDATHPGIVLDPFVGSGTTCTVARELGRRWVGVDLDPCSVALAQRDVGVTVDDPERLPQRGDESTGLETWTDGGGGRGN